MGSRCLQAYFKVVEIENNLSGLYLSIVDFMGSSSPKKKPKVQVRKQW